MRKEKRIRSELANALHIKISCDYGGVWEVYFQLEDTVGDVVDGGWK